MDARRAPRPSSAGIRQLTTVVDVEPPLVGVHDGTAGWWPLRVLAESRLVTAGLRDALGQAMDQRVEGGRAAVAWTIVQLERLGWVRPLDLPPQKPVERFALRQDAERVARSMGGLRGGKAAVIAATLIDKPKGLTADDLRIAVNGGDPQKVPASEDRAYYSALAVLQAKGALTKTSSDRVPKVLWLTPFGAGCLSLMARSGRWGLPHGARAVTISAHRRHAVLIADALAALLKVFPEAVDTVVCDRVRRSKPVVDMPNAPTSGRMRPDVYAPVTLADGSRCLLVIEWETKGRESVERHLINSTNLLHSEVLREDSPYYRMVTVVATARNGGTRDGLVSDTLASMDRAGYGQLTRSLDVRVATRAALTRVLQDIKAEGSYWRERRLS